jgi:hypothetical protein
MGTEKEVPLTKPESGNTKSTLRQCVNTDAMLTDRRLIGGNMSASESNQAEQPSLAMPAWTPMDRMPAWCLALLFGGVVLFTATGLDFLLEKRPRSFLGNIDASAVVAAVVAALLFYRVLWQERERRKAIRRRIETIREMNHHIRNAVQALTAYIPLNQQAAIDDSLHRVDWALREIRP